MDILFKWQALIGSILGGIFALAAALVVAMTVRRREDVASGMVVISILLEIRIAFEALKDLAEKDKVGEEEHPLWFSEKLLNSYPKLSPSFDSSVACLLPINVHLAAHLSLFQKIYSQLLITLTRLEKDYKSYHETKKTIRSNEFMVADAKSITRNYKMAVEHAKCAENLISKLILSKISTWYKIKQLLYASDVEKNCRKILKTGSS